MSQAPLTREQIREALWHFFTLTHKSKGVYVYATGTLYLPEEKIPEDIRRLPIPPKYRIATRYERRNRKTKRR